MEPIFTTETIHDLSVHNEFRRGFQYASLPRTILRLLGCLLIVWYVTLFDNRRIVYIYLALSAYMLIACLLSNRKGGDIHYKRMLMVNGGEPQHMLIQVCENCITAEDRRNGNRYDYVYALFRRVIDTPHLLILVMEHGTCLVLEKRWLRSGTTEELTEFLFTKCTNMKAKKVRKTTFGKWVTRIFMVMLAIGTVIALCCLPKISLFDRLSGRLTNDMSYTEMAVELASLGIAISDQTINELEAYDAEYAAEYGVDYYDDAYSSKIIDMLYWEGSGVYDDVTWEWTPSSSGIFWFDAEVWDVSSIYSDFFAGLSAMNSGLAFQNVTEDYTQADIEAGTGVVTLSFDLNGKHYELDAEYNYDWFDSTVLSEVMYILRTDDNPDNLYFALDGQGYFLYYGSSQQVRQLERITGLDFADSIRPGFLS